MDDSVLIVELTKNSNNKLKKDENEKNCDKIFLFCYNLKYKERNKVWIVLIEKNIHSYLRLLVRYEIKNER